MRTDITAEQRGRHLYITVAAGSEDAIEYKVAPVKGIDAGAALLGQALTIYTGNADDVQAASEALATAGLGAEVHAKASGELRPDEFEAVAFAGVLWNAHGGGFKLVETLFQDGLPKALTDLFESAGAQMVLAPTTSPSTESENPTP
ncbi:hypothetical protein [Mycetocola saprophilus]|uniref:hypothetical protein n=1 Tax=Mycetocola saprophilus TaxID=76636 RepID=UPI0004C0DAD7|nr:hypothetical protein [Mycetocola saprophilus]